DTLRLGHDAAAAFGHGRGRADVRVELARLRVPAEAAGVADEAALDEMLEPAGAVPRALVVRVEHVALGVEADATGRAHAAGGRRDLAFGRDLAGPAAELAVAGERAGQAERDPDVAVPVEARAEGVLVVVAVDAPLVADRLEDVGLAVAVTVLDARQ